MKGEEEEEDEENENLKKENDELNKKILEAKNEINNLKQKNNLINEQIYELKIEKNKLFNENLELKLNCDKHKNEISILNEKINNLNSEITSKNEENESLSYKVTSMIKLSNERFEEAKNIIDKNIKEMKKENRDWRHDVDKLLGKKRENMDDILEEHNKTNIIEIDEKKEEDERYKKQEKEKIKFKIIIENLRTENSLLKYRLSNIDNSKDKVKTNNNDIIMKNTENENNIKINQENIKKLEELMNENKENEEKIKKLEEENNELKLNQISKNTDITSPYNFLIKELESISKQKCDYEKKLENSINEKNSTLSKYTNMDIENESLKSENIMMKKINKNLKEEIQKYKEGDILQNKKETELLKSTISDLEKKYNETSNKFQNLQSDFNHDFGISKKIRLILNYLTNNNKSLEEKINELNIMKEKSQQKEAQLQQMLIDKNSKIEQKEKIIEEEKKKLNEEKLKYIQLNNEYNNLLKLSQVEELNNKYENETEHNKNIRNSFSDLTVLLNKNKEIIPFLNNRLEIVEKENKNLKEQINKVNKYDIEKNNEIVKNKEKEIEELKNQINKMNIKNDNLMKENNMLKTENDLIKGDIRLIGNSMNKIEEKNEQKKNEDEEKSLNEILNQLIKSRNIISFLLNEK